MGEGAEPRYSHPIVFRPQKKGLVGFQPVGSGQMGEGLTSGLGHHEP